MIPKAAANSAGSASRPLRDRVVQAALKLVLEPIFEADFKPCSYGFRPKRRAQDAIAEIHLLATRSYEWVLEGDITACFDEIAHSALLGRVRDRIGDKRVLGLVKAFLKPASSPRMASTGHDDRHSPGRDSLTAARQHRPLGPRRALRRGMGGVRRHLDARDTTPTQGTGQLPHRPLRGRFRRHGGRDTERTPKRLRDEVAAVLAPMGLRLSEEKTRIVHIDEGFDFLGFRIQRQAKRGDRRSATSTPTRRRRRSGLDQGQGAGAHQAGQRTSPLTDPPAPVEPGAARLDQLLPARRVEATFGYLERLHLASGDRWLRRKHAHANWKQLRRRYLSTGGGRQRTG